MTWYMPPVEVVKGICDILGWRPEEGRPLFGDRGAAAPRAGWVFTGKSREVTVSAVAETVGDRFVQAEIKGGDLFVRLRHGHSPGSSLNVSLLPGDDSPLQSSWRFVNPDAPAKKMGAWIRGEFFMDDERGLLVDLYKGRTRVKGRVYRRRITLSGGFNRTPKGYEITLKKMALRGERLILRVDDRMALAGVRSRTYPLARIFGLEGPCGILEIHPPFHPGKTPAGAWNLVRAAEEVLLSSATLVRKGSPSLPILRPPIERFCHPGRAAMLGGAALLFCLVGVLSDQFVAV